MAIADAVDPSASAAAKTLCPERETGTGFGSEAMPGFPNLL